MSRQGAPARGGGTRSLKEDSSNCVPLTIVSVVNRYLLTIEKQGRGSQSERLCVGEPTRWNHPNSVGSLGHCGWDALVHGCSPSTDALLFKEF